MTNDRLPVGFSTDALDLICMTKLVAKSVVLLVLSCAFFVAYSLSAPYFHSLGASASRLSQPSVTTTAALQGFSMALVWGIVFAIPLAWLWGRAAFLAALVCVAPVILITLLAYSQQHRSHSTLVAAGLFIACLVILVPALAQAAHFFLRSRGSLRRAGAAPAKATRSSSRSDHGA